MKLCTDCREVKPLDHFHKDKNKADGHGNMCKECVSRYQRERYSLTKHFRRKRYHKGIGSMTSKEESEMKINTIRYRFKLWQEHGEFR